MHELAYFQQMDATTLVHGALFRYFGSAALSPSIIGSARGAPTHPGAGLAALLDR
jgi:hypothetical protein